MHLLPTTTVALDDDTAVDLRQPPGDIVVLSFADSDLGALASAQARRPGGPSLRLASLRRLRHPLSVDLYADATVAKSRFVVVRCLGGLEYWRYGVERLSAICRAAGIWLAVLPGDDRPDPRLCAYSTITDALGAELDAYFRAGGVVNMERLLVRLQSELDGAVPLPAPPEPVPRAFAWSPESGAQEPQAAVRRLAGSGPLALILVYRSAILAGDTQAIEALAAAMRARAMDALVLAVSSLKDPEAAALAGAAIRARRPDVIVTTTAFSARDDGSFVLDAADCPILQAIPVGSAREAWTASPRGLSAADMAMQVALPECDGRIAAAPVSFKAELDPDPALAFARRVQMPDPAGIDAVADTAAAWVRLARTPAAERRIGLVLSDYPARGGRAGYAVGLDTPASVCAILEMLESAGYRVSRDVAVDTLMHRLTGTEECLAVPLTAYLAWLRSLPNEQRQALEAVWGPPEVDPAVRGGAFRFCGLRAGHVVVALQPDRGRSGDRKAGYHDPGLAPSHAYLAFYLGLKTLERVDAIIHLGTHGTMEWLPGKSVALSNTCWPRLAAGATPVIYPFIVDDPGEAAPAKRRIGAVTLGHLTPPVETASLHGEAFVLRDLVEEFSAARVLDPRRADLVARQILDRARSNGIAVASGISDAIGMEEALTRLDAHLCDLAEVTLRDGLHVFGIARAGFEACAAGERKGLLDALDGRFVVPGPSGSPSRGQTEVLPTGRNLSTFDPRAIPTRSAVELGWSAAAEVVRRHLQEEGDWPRRIVMDLWASPTLRSGGEDLAHALALMGVRPVWDHASTRVTGIEILPLALLDRPRADVTVRISGAFRDTFPDQIALFDKAARAVAQLAEEDGWNALAAARRRGEELSRVFGAAPGRYGAGVASQALDGDWSGRSDLGGTYLDGTPFAFGAAGEGRADASFVTRVRHAEAFIHVSDVAERDILDGDAAADAIGGFAAAAQALGSSPAIYSVDTSRPGSPKARTLVQDMDRLVRGRLTNPRWLDAQLRHGWRGAAEIAQAVDALFAFAATTEAVASSTFDLVFTALMADAAVRERIAAANPPAAQAIRERLEAARRRGLWQSRLNSVALLIDPDAGEEREAAE